MWGGVASAESSELPDWVKQDHLDQIRRLNRQLAVLKDRIPSCGEPLGYELLEEKQYGTTFLRYKYVVKYERKYVIWTFLLVRLKGPWLLHRVNFNTEVEALFE